MTIIGIRGWVAEKLLTLIARTYPRVRNIKGDEQT